MNLVRTFFLVFLWFAFWMVLAGIVWGDKAIIGGFLFAYISGFALPWITPEPIQKWMDAQS